LRYISARNKGGLLRTPTTVVNDGEQGPSQLSLLVMEDESAATIALPLFGVLTIGRGDVAEVRLSDPMVSRQHARLHLGHDGLLEVEDLGSANGTKVGEQRLDPNQRTAIKPGQPITIGATTLVVRHLPGQGKLRRAWPHAYFQARLEEECARAADTREPLAIVRLSVSGELEPAVVADVLAPALRRPDLLGHFAPGEYELLLPSTPPELAAAITQDLTGRLVARGAKVRTGMACLPRDGRQPDVLLALSSDRARPMGPAVRGESTAVIVDDPAMKKLYQMAERIALGMISVLINGETGAGKEVMAEAIHRLSPRAKARFLCLNCATLSETLLESELFGHVKGAFTGATETKAGLLESAPGGTVFLDEVGEMPLGIQARLLRALETREVTRVGALKPQPIDVRFIAATNRDLDKDCEAGRFRRDLYFRLKGVQLELPPLRARPSEILPLARTFAAQFSKDAGLSATAALSPQAEQALLRYAWPGNIRELRNVLERAVLVSGGAEIDVEHLPPELLAPATTTPASGSAIADAAPREVTEPEPTIETLKPVDGPDGARESERERIIRALADHAGNQTRAARQLGISRSGLVAKLEIYQIPRPRKPVA
jgi:DNA-binding NtrC family response regulator